MGQREILRNELQTSGNDLHLQVNNFIEELTKIKIGQKSNTEKHIKDNEVIWQSFEAEILKNIALTRNRVRFINIIKNVSNSLQEQILSIRSETNSTLRSCEDLKKMIEQKQLVINQQMNHVKSCAELPEIKFSQEDRNVINLEQALYDCVRFSTRIRWDVEAPKSVVRGFTLDPKKLTVSVFSENTKDNDLQDRLWEKLNSMRSYDWPNLNYKLDENS